MSCSLPPPLEDARILAYLDGAGLPTPLDDRQLLAHLEKATDGEAAVHLSQCAHCRARAVQLRAEWLRRVEAGMTAALYRRSCPEPDLLGEYQLGLLDRKRATEITRHVAECPHCARELVQLHAFLGDLAPETRPAPLDAAVERVRVRVARLLSGGRLLAPTQPSLAPAYAGVRGSGSEPTIYAAGEVRVIVSANPSAENRGQVQLVGLVTGLETPAGAAIHLWQQDRLIGVTPLDEGGNFIVRDLNSGSYELMLSGPDGVIHIEELQV
jgi:hypothetical protein